MVTRRKLDVAGFVALREYRQEGLGVETRRQLARLATVRAMTNRRLRVTRTLRRTSSAGDQ